MPQRLTWLRLLPGVAVVVALAMLAVGVLTFARVGGVGGETVRLHATMASARNILAGSEVWLVGQKVGVVRGIEFRGVETDTSHRLVVTFDLRRDVVDQLRRDSFVEIRSGGSLLGASVVYLSIGTTDAAPIRPGDTLTGPPQSDPEAIAANAKRGLEDARAILASLGELRRALSSAEGNVGAFRDGRATREVAVLRSGVARLGARSTRGEGAIPAALRRDPFAPRVARISAALDSIRTLVADTAVAFGRFRRDSSLLVAIAGLRAELAEVGVQMGEAHGSAGRFAADSALAREVARVSTALGELFTDIRKRPFRYLAF